MTITAYLPRLGILDRPARRPRHRASDEVETLRLKKVWADSLIKALRVQLDDQDRKHDEVIRRIDERHGETIRGLERELQEARERLDVACRADTVITQTQEIDASEIQRHFVTAAPPHQAPFATTNPGRLPCSWDVKDDEPEPAA